MERQAGLGRSLEDVLDSLPPVEPTDQAPTHALFGIAPEEHPVANGTHEHTKKNKKTKQHKKKSEKKHTTSKKKKSKSKRKDTKSSKGTRSD